MDFFSELVKLESAACFEVTEKENGKNQSYQYTIAMFLFKGLLNMPLQTIALKLLTFVHCKKLSNFVSAYSQHTLGICSRSPHQAKIPLELNGFFPDTVSRSN